MDEQALNEKYPGRMVYREGDRIVVKIPVRFRRRWWATDDFRSWRR